MKLKIRHDNSYSGWKLQYCRRLILFMCGFFASQTYEMTMTPKSQTLNEEELDTLNVDGKLLGKEDKKKKYVNLTKEFYDDKKVLDIGCGPRGSLEWMKKAKSRVCVDPLAHRYGNLGSFSHDMMYLFAGAESIPIPSMSFDVVTSINNLDHVTDVDASVKEIARLVRVGGHFVLIVELHTKPKPCEPQAINVDIDKDFEKLGFEMVWTKRTEYKNDKCKVAGTGALSRCPEFDTENKEKRDSFLGLVMKKVK